MSSYFNGEEQSLMNILEARDMRVEYQEYLLSKYNNTIVSYKMNIPGPVKYNSLIKQIFDEGLVLFKQRLSEFSIEPVHEKTLYQNSGPEYFGSFNAEADAIKILSTSIEENHPLGRLYDFDVIDFNGEQISRRELGLGQRKCLLCDNNAFECGRSRSHEISKLIAEIENMALEYFKDKGGIK